MALDTYLEPQPPVMSNQYDLMLSKQRHPLYVHNVKNTTGTTKIQQGRQRSRPLKLKVTLHLKKHMI